MAPARPSLRLLSSLTDEHVLRALMSERQLTRAELAARTGISKPTVAESVGRLVQAGALRDTGERTTGRGRVGTYYALSDAAGVALVVSIAPGGVVAETVDVFAQVQTRAVQPIPRTAAPARVTRALHAAVQAAQPDRLPLRVAVVSAADPVDRATGNLLHLPDAPFLVGELSPVEALAPLVTGPVAVDNDVNWAARAERAAAGGDLDNFAYLYLGDGVGCAIVADGEARRGHRGTAGEIAHLVTRAPGGEAAYFTDVFARLGLRRPDSTAIDTGALLEVVRRTDARARGVRDALADAVSDVLAAVVALADPELVVLGGTWGADPEMLDIVRAAFARRPRHVPIRAPQVSDEPALAGARNRAVEELRAAILARSSP